MIEIFEIVHERSVLSRLRKMKVEKKYHMALRRSIIPQITNLDAASRSAT